MVAQLEIFADITCPFTHVGIKKVLAETEDYSKGLQVVIRAWPLEWVNGEPLAAKAVDAKISALREQLGMDAFKGFKSSSWPTTTIPALNLAAAGYRRDLSTGLEVSLALRDALFENGSDIGNPGVLASIAARFDLDPPGLDADSAVLDDYEDGKLRGVRGSPDFWLGDEEFFCPALTLGHNDEGLTAEFDEEGLQQFMMQVRALVQQP